MMISKCNNFNKKFNNWKKNKDNLLYLYIYLKYKTNLFLLKIKIIIFDLEFFQ